MKTRNIAIAAALLCAVTLSAIPADKETKTTSTPTTQPASKVVATVGEVSITSDKIAQAMKRMRAPSKQRALDQLVMQELIEAYARTIQCTPKDIEAWKTKMSVDLKARKLGTLENFMKERNITKDMIERIVRFENLEKQAMKAASPQAIETFTKAHPSFFDGTEVQASHILLSCPQ